MLWSFCPTGVNARPFEHPWGWLHRTCNTTRCRGLCSSSNLAQHNLVKGSSLNCYAQRSGIVSATEGCCFEQEAFPRFWKRRDVVCGVGALMLALQNFPAAASDLALGGQGIKVIEESGEASTYSSITLAVAAAPAGATIVVPSGVYRERILLEKAVTLKADPEGAEVVVVWEAKEPYQSVLQSSAAGARVIGLTLRHSSPSVANNYAVFMQGGELVLEGCDISSTSGSGVGAEGGAAVLRRCTVHDCARHGVALFGDLETGTGAGVVEDCSILENKLNGILIRDGCEPHVERNNISGNGEYGLLLKDCGGDFVGNQIAKNRKGSLFLGRGVTSTAEELVTSNRLDRPPQKE